MQILKNANASHFSLSPDNCSVIMGPEVQVNSEGTT